MKIALQLGAPEPEQLRSLIQTCEAEAGSAGWNPILTTAPQMIAAYDSGRLVGIGGRIQAPGQAPELKVIVAPGYEKRGIDGHMAKLLLPRNERIS